MLLLGASRRAKAVVTPPPEPPPTGDESGVKIVKYLWEHPWYGIPSAWRAEKIVRVSRPKLPSRLENRVTYTKNIGQALILRDRGYKLTPLYPEEGEYHAP